MDMNDILEAVNEINSRLVRMEEKVDNTMRIQYASLEVRVQKLEENERWKTLTVMGLIIAGILNLVIK